MLTMDKVHFIRRLYYEQGKNIPTIIAETGYDRKTICKYIDMTDFNIPEPKVKDPENICPKLDNYKPLIDEWLAGDMKAPRKQRHTAKILKLWSYQFCNKRKSIHFQESGSVIQIIQCSCHS